ncbi:MAG: sigma-70 family RNA polymerase sigma factor [Chthonomonadales bacterium]|nr:sigma-70 family RNA polymerase sigma factor [Chthonomonadales bacterium]
MAYEAAASRRETYPATGVRVAEYEDMLAVRARDGDRGAFDVLVGRYQARLIRFALRMVKDGCDAEDVVQATLVRAYRGLGRYRPGGFFSSWIYRIALNECRRKLRTRPPSHEPLERGAEVPARFSGADPERAIVTQDRNRLVRDAVSSLPVHYREVMMLFYFEDMSVEETARALDLSISAVKVRLHRARARLSQTLAEAL